MTHSTPARAALRARASIAVHPVAFESAQEPPLRVTVKRALAVRLQVLKRTGRHARRVNSCAVPKGAVTERARACDARGSPQHAEAAPPPAHEHARKRCARGARAAAPSVRAREYYAHSPVASVRMRP